MTLRNNGVLLVLLEMPSGFAVFNFCGIYLYLPDAIQSMWVKFANYYRARRVVWLKEFQTFDDKSRAINADTGVNKQLTQMILKWRRPGQELLVGKPEYKSVIEASLGIPCRHDELVMEVMWGMKRFMPSLVRREKSELPKEDLLPVSQGLQMLLSSYGFDVKPEMVNDQIVATASVLFDCDAAEKKQYRDFHALGRHLKNVSGIEYENWDLLKLATAFKIICSREIGDSDEMLSEDVQTKLLDDADKYEKKINKLVCMLNHHEVVSNYQIKTRHKDMLAGLVKKAKEARVRCPVRRSKKVNKAYGQ
ncbi:uncharacterized protein [Aegilops tauschii subsp. strangulata]|uniref:uncharacterized protein n=1 Tax=Aegilops tauschii subsp. strangulata TaxID=200361 RepID=UPI00098BC20D|nr:nucleolar protein 58 [Aegilops tauschii subsp. strangulata]XP_045089345.1 nucleolar protein 58 [Aegilops tauschii subsp. strangulata]